MSDEIPYTGPTEPTRRKAVGQDAYDRGARRRKAMLDAIKDGLSVMDAVREAGWSTHNGYWSARQRYPAWAAEVDYALGAARTRSREEVEEERSGPAPIKFGERVERWFGEANGGDRAPHKPHQLLIADILEGIGPREVVMVLLWPEAGKTATLEDYICLKLADHPEHRFRYVSESADLAKRVVGTCQRRFTDTGRFGEFIARYGPFYDKGQERRGMPWTTEQFTILTNPGTERDRNLVATSWTAANYGARIDTVIFDDLQSQRNMNQAEEIFRRVRGTFFNRGKLLRTLIIGTRIGPGDVYERMLDAGIVTRQIVLSAADPVTGDPRFPEWWDVEIYHDGGACCPPALRPCPRNHEKLTPREYLDLMHFQQGEQVWQASYQQNPKADELSTFGSYLDACLDRDRRFGPLVA